MTLQRSHKTNSQAHRWYWALLVLALFVAAQCLGVAHWHNKSNTPDYDCSLCVLSSATGTAATVNGWLPLAVVPFVFVVFFFVPTVRRAVVRFHDSRGPPSLLSHQV